MKLIKNFINTIGLIIFALGFVIMAIGMSLIVDRNTRIFIAEELSQITTAAGSVAALNKVIKDYEKSKLN